MHVWLDVEIVSNKINKARTHNHFFGKVSHNKQTSLRVNRIK